MHGPVVTPDRAKPFSHLVTGVVVRSFAAHERYRISPEATHAGELLASRFFQRDAHPDRGTFAFWTKFSFPFWFTDLLSSLDSLSRLGFDRSAPAVGSATKWFIDRQQSNGTWNVKMLKTGDRYLRLWLSLAICRVLERLKE